ncbi:MAG: SOS response-associated peptidase [Kiloniellales bacterium]|nr:SOS response-associated peptidase [Kiloniellales bacterium]
MAEKPSFREAFKKRRCIIPASGFYEWTGPKGNRQAYYICGRDGALLSFAGLWESWKDKENEERIETFTIIVTEANDFIRPWHHRMPVVLEPESFEAWLAGEAGTELLRPAANNILQGHMVGPNVGNVKNDYPDLVERIKAKA